MQGLQVVLVDEPCRRRGWGVAVDLGGVILGVEVLEDLGEEDTVGEVGPGARGVDVGEGVDLVGVSWCVGDLTVGGTLASRPCA